MNAQSLINAYLKSRGRRAQADIGKVTVSIAGGDLTDLPLVEVNWPGIGAQDPCTALSFCAHLTEACALALAVERIIEEWDGVDQWREPGL